MADFRFPTYKQRTLIVGRTGSGKTQFGTWLLSHAPFDKQPYIIIDYKHDDLLNGSDRVHELALDDPLPKKPGLYIVHPRPDEEDAVEAWMWRVWEREKIGLYFDEGYMIDPRSDALRSILTQGRSKRIPVIMLSQRPSQICRFAISEADFYSVFHQNDKNDRKRIEEFTPTGFAHSDMPEYNSKWYDVAKNQVYNLAPVPQGDEILERIETRLTHKRTFI